MKKTLLYGFNVIALMILAQSAIGQLTMPAAITIEPGNGTGWDEITLTLDPSQACVPDGKGSVAGAAKVFMHSAAVLFDQKEDFEAKSVWGAVGIDYDAEPKDGVHTETALLPNGDGTYSITFTPGDYYGVEEGSTIIGITAVFNSGTWDNECKDNADDGCGDFFIPLTYTDPTPALKFKLDLTYQEELGNFDKDGGKAYVIVDETEYEMDQLLEGIFPVAKYEYTLKDGLVEGTGFTYKFKMDDTEETVEARNDTVTGSQKTLSHFFNDEEPNVATATFKVDMRYYIREGWFDSATQYVDIAGDMNGWDGTDHHLIAEADSMYSIEISDVNIGTHYNFKFRIDGSWADETSEFPAGGPNRYFTVRSDGGTYSGIYNNYKPGYVPVTLAVNMARAEAAGIFDPETNFLDVAGSMNNWGASDELKESDSASVYVTAIPVLAVAEDSIEYKFRIDASWDDNKHEFPAGGPARKFGVKDTTGGVVNANDTVWFNDIALFIDSPVKQNIHEVSVYPNPVQDRLYIDNTFEVERLMIVNVLGQVIRDIRTDSQMFMTLDVSDLERGIYILSVYGNNDFKGTAKFMIK